MGSRLDQKSNLVRKRIENHTFEGEHGEEYEGSAFGGFPEYFRRKKIKLQNLDAELRAQSTDKPQIFKGIVCHVNGYTQPSLNDLHTMIVQHGGGFLQYLDGKTMVTHIIASNLTPKKKEEFRRYRIVKPAWIVDSISAGKVLPWDEYRVVDEGVGQKVLGFENGQVVSQASRKAAGYREQTETSWYTSQLRQNDSQPAQHPRIRPKFSAQEPAEDEGIDYEDNPVAGHDEAEAEKDFTTVETTEYDVELSGEDLSRMRGLTTDLKRHVSPEAHDVSEDKPPLRPREGSQEPDYSMAVVRHSEILKAVSPARLAQMTAEEHNALLLSDPKIRKSTVVHPDFLEQYYRESRLHHLSTWKADLKSQMQALTADESAVRNAKRKKIPGQRRYIMHVDFDSFFAAISLKKYPEFKDKPAAVAHGGGSGSEIASCNYPARGYGVHNGMWMKRAQELCPDLKILPYDFPGYEDASRKFYDAILATGGIVQSVSIDEALVDVTSICLAESGSDGIKRSEGSVDREESKADQLAQQLRDEVFKLTGCAVSVGIGGNILQAKVALRKAKPAGQYLLKPDQVLDFIGQLEVQKLPGVAWSIGGKLEDIGIKFVRDIREVSKEKLINTLGPKTGEKIWEYARGIDRVEVGDQVVRKSVSAEVNWGVRFENHEQVDEFMHGLCGELHKRLTKERVKGKQLTMKVMRRAADAPLDPPKHLGHGKCDTINKSTQLGVATNDTGVITKEAISMLKSMNVSPGELRGIGVQMQKLDPIKAGPEGLTIASQRKLKFKVPEPPINERVVHEVHDDVANDSPRAEQLDQRRQPVQSPQALSASMAKALNTTGTQFVLPTQVDPAVLAELPEDIRSKLAKQSKSPLNPTAGDGRVKADWECSKPTSRAASPAVVLPNQSQLDPEILQALPEDVRAEVMEYYKAPKKGGQALLPQSPRKTRTLPPTKQPVKRKRGGSSLFPGRARSKLHGEGSSTLTQSNFVAQGIDKATNDEGATTTTTTTDTEAEAVGLDPEFLAALPEDLRREVLDQQRRDRLKRTGGIDVSARRKKLAPPPAARLDRHIRLPPQPAKPTFTSRKLTELPDLRKAISAWVQEFSDEAPFDEDVDALAKYLSAVVVDEHNMEKAVAVLQWLEWVIDDGEWATNEEVQEAWRGLLERVRASVQAAASSRGLGALILR